MPWYGVLITVVVSTFSLAVLLIAVAAVMMATRKTPKPPERGRS